MATIQEAQQEVAKQQAELSSYKAQVAGLPANVRQTQQQLIQQTPSSAAFVKGIEVQSANLQGQLSPEILKQETTLSQQEQSLGGLESQQKALEDQIKQSQKAIDDYNTGVMWARDNPAYGLYATQGNANARQGFLDARAGTIKRQQQAIDNISSLAAQKEALGGEIKKVLDKGFEVQTASGMKSIPLGGLNQNQLDILSKAGIVQVQPLLLDPKLQELQGRLNAITNPQDIRGISEFELAKTIGQQNIKRLQEQRPDIVNTPYLADTFYKNFQEGLKGDNNYFLRSIGSAERAGGRMIGSDIEAAKRTAQFISPAVNEARDIAKDMVTTGVVGAAKTYGLLSRGAESVLQSKPATLYFSSAPAITRQFGKIAEGAIDLGKTAILPGVKAFAETTVPAGIIQSRDLLSSALTIPSRGFPITGSVVSAMPDTYNDLVNDKFNKALSSSGIKLVEGYGDRTPGLSLNDLINAGEYNYGTKEIYFNKINSILGNRFKNDVLAHEFGHSIQGQYNARTDLAKQIVDSQYTGSPVYNFLESTADKISYGKRNVEEAVARSFANYVDNPSNFKQKFPELAKEYEKQLKISSEDIRVLKPEAAPSFTLMGLGATKKAYDFIAPKVESFVSKEAKAAAGIARSTAGASLLGGKAAYDFIAPDISSGLRAVPGYNFISSIPGKIPEYSEKVGKPTIDTLSRAWEIERGVQKVGNLIGSRMAGEVLAIGEVLPKITSDVLTLGAPTPEAKAKASKIIEPIAGAAQYAIPYYGEALFFAKPAEYVSKNGPSGLVTYAKENPVDILALGSYGLVKGLSKGYKYLTTPFEVGATKDINPIVSLIPREGAKSTDLLQPLRIYSSPEELLARNLESARSATLGEFRIEAKYPEISRTTTTKLNQFFGRAPKTEVVRKEKIIDIFTSGTAPKGIFQKGSLSPEGIIMVPTRTGGARIAKEAEFYSMKRGSSKGYQFTIESGYSEPIDLTKSATPVEKYIYKKVVEAIPKERLANIQTTTGGVGIRKTAKFEILPSVRGKPGTYVPSITPSGKLEGYIRIGKSGEGGVKFTPVIKDGVPSKVYKYPQIGISTTTLEDLEKGTTLLSSRVGIKRTSPITLNPSAKGRVDIVSGAVVKLPVKDVAMRSSGGAAAKVTRIAPGEDVGKLITPGTKRSSQEFLRSLYAKGVEGNLITSIRSAAAKSLPTPSAPKVSIKAAPTSLDTLGTIPKSVGGLGLSSGRYAGTGQFEVSSGLAPGSLTKTSGRQETGRAIDSGLSIKPKSGMISAFSPGITSAGEQGIKPISGLSVSPAQITSTDNTLKITERQAQRIDQQLTPQTTLRPVVTAPPLPVPFNPVPEKPSKIRTPQFYWPGVQQEFTRTLKKPAKKSRPSAFLVATKERRKTRLVSATPLSLGEALTYGAKATRSTARASFELIPTKKAPKTLGLAPTTVEELISSGEFRRPVKRGKEISGSLRFVQPTSRRIKTSGEIASITRLGIAKRKSRRGFF